MTIYLGTDHAGYELKEALKVYLGELGYAIADKGALALEDGDDYPDYVRPVAEAVVGEAGSFGIVLGASGEGEAMCANRVSGARAAVYYGGSLDIPRHARVDNDANILSLGARFVSPEEAKEAVKVFLETPFSNEERHARRIAKIDK
jgi:ribose 5-phosphate isomerase B